MQAIQLNAVNDYGHTHNGYFNFKELYDKVFIVKRALTPEDIKEAHRIRYQVYCIENQYENPEQSVFGEETDEYDDNCITSLLIHRHTGLTVGTVRVILPDTNNLDSCLPIQKLCDIKKYDSEYDPAVAGEISRFCISKQMRKRICDTSQYLGFYEPDPNHKICTHEDKLTKRAIPYAALGLVKSVFEISAEHNMHYIYAAMEPFLIRSLGMLGIPSTPLGPVVDYHGKRQPAKFRAIEAYENCKKHNYDTWRIISDNGRLHAQELLALEHEAQKRNCLFL